MKNLLFLSLLLIIISSCKKDYVCNCVSGSSSQNLHMPETLRSDAKEACVDMEYYTGYSCTLNIE